MSQPLEIRLEKEIFFIRIIWGKQVNNEPAIGNGVHWKLLAEQHPKIQSWTQIPALCFVPFFVLGSSLCFFIFIFWFFAWRECGAGDFCYKLCVDFCPQIVQKFRNRSSLCSLKQHKVDPTSPSCSESKEKWIKNLGEK